MNCVIGTWLWVLARGIPGLPACRSKIKLPKIVKIPSLALWKAAEAAEEDELAVYFKQAVAPSFVGGALVVGLTP